VTALVFAFGLVAGIVGLAVNQADDPTIKRFLQRRRLDTIARKPDRTITFPEAEDALAIARRLGDEKMQVRFGKLVALKQHTRRLP
jgi:hypothetical protein